MSKRDALRELIKKFPPPEELKGIIEGLSHEPDRSAAIVAAAVVEGLLERIIVHRLDHRDANLIGQLFQNRGPLSDLHSKILIADAFGIVSRNAAADMHRIKAIRNVFAHAPHKVTFDTPEIAKEVDAFIAYNAMRQVGTKDEKQFDMSNKRIYLLMAHLLCIAHDCWHQERGGEPIVELYKTRPIWMPPP